MPAQPSALWQFSLSLLSFCYSKQPKRIRNKQTTRQPDAGAGAAVVLPVLSRTQLNRTETELN